MPKKYNTVIDYYDECWQQHFWFLEGWEAKDAVAFLNKKGFQDVGINKNGCGRTLWNLDGTGQIVVWTKPSDTLAKRCAILAHECIHAAHVCLARCGVKPCFDNDEAVTYLVTVLMRKALGEK